MIDEIYKFADLFKTSTSEAAIREEIARNRRKMNELMMANEQLSHIFVLYIKNSDNARKQIALLRSQIEKNPKNTQLEEALIAWINYHNKIKKEIQAIPGKMKAYSSEYMLLIGRNKDLMRLLKTTY